MHALRERFGARLDGCSADEIQALVAAEVEDGVSNQRLQEMLSLHRVDITKMLKELVQKDFLRADKKGRWTRYHLIDPGDALAPADSGEVTPDSGEVTPDLDKVTPDSGEVTPDSGEVTPDSGEVTLDSGEETPHSREEWGQLMRLAEPVRQTGAAPGSLVEQTILQLCEGRFLSLRELAELLDRSPEALRNRYITRMVSEGRLVRRYPDHTQHRQQAYRTADDYREAA